MLEQTTEPETWTQIASGAIAALATTVRLLLWYLDRRDARRYARRSLDERRTEGRAPAAPSADSPEP